MCSLPRQTIAAAWSLLATLLLWSPGAHATGAPASSEKEARVIVVTKWDASCDASNRTSLDNMLNGWYGEIADSHHGSKAWVKDGFQKNGDIVDSEFITALINWGEDSGIGHVDDVDAIFVGLHGTHDDNSYAPWDACVRVDESGSGDCYAYQGDMQLGDFDLEFLHLWSCHSMCDHDEPSAAGNWKSTFKGLHQVNGFYGLSWSSLTYVGECSGFADDAFDVSITDAWKDNTYSDGFWTSGYDHCPVSMVAGSSESDACSRASNEEYDYVYSDVDSPSYFYYVSIGGCDPKDHDP